MYKLISIQYIIEIKLTTSQITKWSKNCLEKTGFKITEIDASVVTILYRQATDNAATKYLHKIDLIICLVSTHIQNKK